jgi:hypothetical protein
MIANTLRSGLAGWITTIRCDVLASRRPPPTKLAIETASVSVRRTEARKQETCRASEPTFLRPSGVISCPNLINSDSLGHLLCDAGLVANFSGISVMVSNGSAQEAAHAQGSLELEPNPKILEALRSPSEEAIRAVGAAGDHHLTVCYCLNPYQGFQPLTDISFAALFDMMLSNPTVQAEKSRNGLIWGTVKGRRTNSNTTHNSALVYDIDGRLTFDEVLLRLKKAQLASVAWTTFHHHTERTELAATAVDSWRVRKGLQTGGELSDEEAAEFVAETDNGKRAHLCNVRVCDDGKAFVAVRGHRRFKNYAIKHDPVCKCRAVILLHEPIPLIEVGMDGYKWLYNECGTDLFGEAVHDKSCANPCRIQWNPARRSQAHEYAVRYQDGNFFNWREKYEKMRPRVLEARALRATRSLVLLREPRGDLQDLAKVLRSIPPDIPRPEWFSVIAAVHRETNGSADGETLVHDWSSGAPELYDGHDLHVNIWQRLDAARDGGATRGTLIYLAKKYDPDFKVSPPKDFLSAGLKLFQSLTRVRNV